MKAIIKATIFCAFISLYSVSDVQTPEKDGTQATKNQKESEVKKMSLSELTIEVVTDKRFWDGIFKGMFLVVPFYIKEFTGKRTVFGWRLSEFQKLLPINEITVRFKSLTRSAQVYLFQHYLRNLGHQIKEIFNVPSEKIFLVTSDNNIRCVSKNSIFMPFKDALDITKLKEFFGVLAHEVVHLKNKHYMLSKVFDYACFIPIMYGMYKIALERKKSAEDTLFEDLFESSFLLR